MQKDLFYILKKAGILIPAFLKIVKEVLYMGRKNVIIPTDIIVGNFFRIKEEQKTKEGRQRYSISLMSPEKKMLHQKGVKVRIRAAGKEDPKVYEAAEKLIRKNSKIVVEWIKEGSLPQAPSMLLLHIIAEESVQKAYGIGEERKPFLIEALQNLPPLKELEGTADVDTLRVVDAVAHTKEDKIGLKRALNIIYDGAVKCGIWKENISSKVLVTARSTTEKADKNLKTRIFTLEELRKLTQSCIEHMDKEALYAALLLQLTTGVKVGELCGLNLSSVWKYEELRVLKIDGKMTQKRGEEAEWRLYDREYGKLRFVELFGDGNHPHIALIDLIIEGAGLSYGIVQPGDDGTGDMGVLRPVDMVDGKISTASIKYIDRSIGDGFKKTELYGDELLITVRGTTGITALTDIRFNGMNVTRGIAVVRYDRNKINPVYLNAYLNTDESQRYIQEHTRGATLQQINLSDLRVQQIMVPPLALQEQMAAFIEQTDKSKVVVQDEVNGL